MHCTSHYHPPPPFPRCAELKQQLASAREDLSQLKAQGQETEQQFQALRKQLEVSTTLSPLGQGHPSWASAGWG